MSDEVKVPCRANDFAPDFLFARKTLILYVAQIVSIERSHIVLVRKETIKIIDIFHCLV